MNIHRRIHSLESATNAVQPCPACRGDGRRFHPIPPPEVLGETARLDDPPKPNEHCPMCGRVTKIFIPSPRHSQA